MKIPTPERQKQVTLMVQQAGAEMDEANQSIERLMEFFEQEDKISAMRSAIKLRIN